MAIVLFTLATLVVLIVYLAIDTNRALRVTNGKCIFIYFVFVFFFKSSIWVFVFLIKVSLQQCSIAHEDYAEEKDASGGMVQLKTYTKFAVAVDNFYCSSIGRWALCLNLKILGSNKV